MPKSRQASKKAGFCNKLAQKYQKLMVWYVKWIKYIGFYTIYNRFLDDFIRTILNSEPTILHFFNDSKESIGVGV